MSTAEKKFLLTHVFKNVSSAQDDQRYYSEEEEEHFKLPWKLYYTRKDGSFQIYLNCCKSLEGDEWRVETDCQMTVKSQTNNDLSRSNSFVYGNANQGTYIAWGWPCFLSWKELEKDYVANDTIVVEACVTIKNMTGIGYTKEKLRLFDKTMKQYSDVKLVVDDEKFYVLKQFLAIHSTFFNSLLLGKFKESKQEDIKLSGINPQDFQKYLEVLYGDSAAIDDDTVEDIYELADMYDTQMVIRKCEEFLCKESKKPLKKRLELAMKFKMEKLKEKCVSDVKSLDDLRAALPADIRGLDQATATGLLEKFYLLH